MAPAAEWRVLWPQQKMKSFLQDSSNEKIRKKNMNRPQTTRKTSSRQVQNKVNLNKTTGSQNILDNERCFISTNSSMFFEHDNIINIDKMVAIPISPMYTEPIHTVNWDTEFFARGATSLPGARNESSLPGLSTSRKSSQNQPRQLFSRQNSEASSPSEFDVSPRSHPIGRLASLPVSSSPNSIDESKLKEAEIEPWAFKIISKHNTEIRRPQSRCTTRLRGNEQSSIGPPLHLTDLTHSKSCPEFKRTLKLASLP